MKPIDQIDFGPITAEGEAMIAAVAARRYNRIAERLGAQRMPVTLAPARPEQRYKLRSADELLHAKPIAWRVKGVIPEQGIGAIFGPSGCGKSFLAIDLAMSIAKGGDWFGHRVKRYPVLYVCLEGEAGLSVRVKAYSAVNGPIPRGIDFIDQPLNLLNPTDVRDLVAVITDRAVPHGVVIIDTLNRAAPGMDENSSVDMGQAVAAAKAVQAAIGGMVLLVHHTGKDATKGMRGHSSLHAALDAAIEVRREGDGREWSVAKSKDGADGLGHQFKLDVVDLGLDSDGDAITSCVVKVGEAGLKVKPLTAPQQIGMHAFMEAALHNAPTPDDQRVRASLDQWRDAYYRRSGAITTDNKRRAFNRARTDLLDLRRVREVDGLYLLIDEPDGFPDLT
ncbi:MAG: helicase RepA family protein [Hydrogenophaga sp.]|jgi:hypothetical protein|nr:helicase RepA family protein [Hydrogenophaga sp.]